MTVGDIATILEEVHPTRLEVNETDTPSSILIDHQNLLPVCRKLHEHQALYFDCLSCLTGIDNGAEKGTMEVIYNLYSIPFHISLMLKTVISRDTPQIGSVSQIWKTADWHERETYDLLGIRFLDHPDMRRVLLPTDWEGFPLRKDYQPQEHYHDVKVAWEGSSNE